MKEEGKPLMIIYVPHHIGKLKKMLNLWNKMAVEAGFKGLKFIYQNGTSHFDRTMDKSLFDYGIEFQPGFSQFANFSKKDLFLSIWAPTISAWLQKYFHLYIGISNRKNAVSIHSYDKTWEKILKRRPDSDKMIPCAFVDWDNTPRRNIRGSVYVGASPEKFKKYFRQLVVKAREVYQTDKLFVFAWNEWAEGGYLEPDEKFGYGYLNAIRDALKEVNEDSCYEAF